MSEAETSSERHGARLVSRQAGLASSGSQLGGMGATAEELPGDDAPNEPETGFSNVAIGQQQPFPSRSLNLKVIQLQSVALLLEAEGSARDCDWPTPACCGQMPAICYLPNTTCESEAVTVATVPSCTTGHACTNTYQS